MAKQYFYQGSFLDDDINTIPDGAVEISDEEKHALFEGQKNGCQIITGPDGKPQLTDPSEFKWSQFQDEARAALHASDATVLRCYEGSVQVPAEWISYRKSLRAIVSADKVGDMSKGLPKQPPFPTGT
jgi:hypothetical protein